MAKSTADVSSISESWWSMEEEEDELFTNHQQQLFGRSDETALLHHTFEQVLETKRASTVVVHGESGVGKTSLVDTLRARVVESGGYFCAGKFFQNSELQEPYSAIMSAFSDLCDLVDSDCCSSRNDKRKREIQRKLGSDGYLLTKAVSNITPFLLKDQGATGDSMRSNEVDLVVNDNSLAKFKVACKTFLQAMSSDDHPVVIFFDDIQWMDKAGSRPLIELFINDKELRNVLLILTYRDEEAENATSILQQHEANRFVDIQVARLNSTAIHDLVCTLTEERSERMRELSELVDKRSEGNRKWAVWSAGTPSYCSIVCSHAFLRSPFRLSIISFSYSDLS